MSSSGTEQTSASGRIGWHGLVVLVTAGAPPGVALGCLLPVLPKIETALAHNPEDSFLVKFISTAAGFAMVAGAPLGGYLSDRYGRKPVLVGSMLMFALFGMLGYFLDNLYEMIAARFMVGVAAAGAVASGTTLIGDYFEGDMRNRLMGLNVAFATILGGLSIPAAAFLGQASWRAPFLLHGVTIILAILALWLKTPQLAKPAATSGTVLPSSASAEPFPYGLVLFAVATGTVVLSSMVFVPFRVRELGVNTPTLMSIALTASVLTNIVSSAMYGPIRRYISVEQGHLVTFAFCGLGAFVMALSPAYWGLIVGALIFGCGMGGAAASLLTVAAGSVSQARRGRVVGAVKGAFLSGNFVAVIVYEPFSKIWGAWASLFAIGSFATAMLVYCVLRYGVVSKPRLQSAA